MADRNLQNVSTGYPLLSCHELLEYRKKLDQTLPKTGMDKGYLPDESSKQEKFLPSMIEDRLDVLKEQRAARNRDLVRAEWNPEIKRAYVTKCKGKAMQNVGEKINEKVVLYPEEVLFLMEMSMLELYYNGVMQSIQEAYRLLLGEEMSLEKFQVYSHLRRIGYIVVRHKKRRWNDSSQSEKKSQEQNVPDTCSEQQNSSESQKHLSENEYCRWNDSSQSEKKSQEQNVPDKYSRGNTCSEQQNSSESQKHLSENEYCRWNDSQSEKKSQEQNVPDKYSRGNTCSEQQNSSESQKHLSENEYYNYMSKKDIDMRRDSAEIKHKSKTTSRRTCLWEGIDLPNIAGKKLIELKMPPSHLLPKNVCPQKQNYVIDVNASKKEVEDYYNEYYEYNIDTNYRRTEFSENQTYVSGGQTSNDYNTSNNFYGSNKYQLHNISQDQRHHCTGTSVESVQCSIPSAIHESTKLHLFPENSGRQEQSYNINLHHMQHSIHSVHNNFIGMQTRCDSSYNQAASSELEKHDLNYSYTLDQNKVPPSNNENADVFYSHRQNQEQQYHKESNVDQHDQSYDMNRNYVENPHCTVSSSDSNYQYYYHRNSGNLESNQFQNMDQNYYHSKNASKHCPDISTQKNENIDNDPSASMSRVNISCNNSSYYCENSYKENRSYRQEPEDSSNLGRRSYNESNEEAVHNEKVSKQHIHKEQNVSKRKEQSGRKYGKNDQQKKRRRDKTPENSSPFPRVSKLVKCWKEFKHEAELQSTAEYLMNGPAKILWNNDIIPLVAPSEHLTKENVFGALSIIKSVDKSENCVLQPSYSKPDFDVYLPTTNYSYYDPGPPNHSIIVVRCKDPTPSLEYRGKIPVHYAVVDNGCVTFFSFSNINLPSYV